MRKTIVALTVLVFVAIMISGCTANVPGAKVGRIKTADGWGKEILYPGRHTCWGRDEMYLLDVSAKAFKEHMNILVGGKVNLTVDITTRVKVNKDNQEGVQSIFDNITATEDKDGNRNITEDQLYITYLQMKVQAIPRELYEVQPDVQTAVANSPALAKEVRKRITEAAKGTVLNVEDVEISNYDWPKSITAAQEELVKAQLQEATAAAQVKAALQKAKGDLAVAEAQKLVTLKNAEGIAESIGVIKKTLAGAPEYLMWHQIDVLGEAAKSQNNAFFFYPYSTDLGQVKQMVNNAQLSHMIQQAEKPKSK